MKKPLMRNEAVDNAVLELDRAEREGERRILLEVAKLPSPVAMASPIDEQCLWCGMRWSRRRDTGWSPEPHPDNGCLWPRAQQAKEGK